MRILLALLLGLFLITPFARAQYNSASTGGTGVSSPTAHGVMIGEGSAAMTATGACTTGNVLTCNSSGTLDPTFQAPTIAANNAISSTNDVSGQAGANQGVAFEDAPAVYHYLGDGSESDPAVFANANCTGSGAPVACCTGSGTGTCTSAQTIQGAHLYANLTVGSGATLTVGSTGTTAASPTDSPPRSFIARVTGTCTIAGTITGNAMCSASTCGGGGSGGSGGSGAANSSGGNNSTWGVVGGTVGANIVAGGGAASSAGAGNAGVTPTAASEKFVLSDPFVGVLGGVSGSQGGSSGGAGGSGGGSVMLICGTINFTGSVTVNGGTGTAGGASTGGGGGGSGGVIIMAAKSYSANSGTMSETHGNGGGAGTGTSFAGGNGGDGWNKQYTLN